MVTNDVKKINAYNELVIVEAEIKPKQEGGIIIPSNSDDGDLCLGEVVSVNPTAKYIYKKNSIAVGDTILFSKSRGLEIKLKKFENQYLLKEDDILAICE
jgi:co-chaperonin GroES (HSP10)